MKIEGKTVKDIFTDHDIRITNEIKEELGNIPLDSPVIRLTSSEIFKLMALIQKN